jgi:hypothetical protein
MFSDFPAFAPVLKQGSLVTGTYLVLLNLNDQPSEAVRIVDRCMNAVEDTHKQVSNLFKGS